MKYSLISKDESAFDGVFSRQGILLIMIFLVPFIPVNMFSQNEQMHTIEGKLQIGDDGAAPTEGTIRYNDETNDFEGWNGSEWKSFTFDQDEVANAFIDPNAGPFSYIGNDTDMSWNLAVAGSLATNKVQVFAVTDGCWGWQYSISNAGIPSSTTTSDFGTVVDLFGGYNSEILAVGEPGNSHYGNAAGIVGVYRLDHTGSTYRYHIAPSDIAAGDAFGRDISASGVHMAISSPYDDNTYSNAGAVYIYRDNVTGAAMKQKITSPQAVANGNFGYKVLMSGYDLFIYARGEGGWTLNGRVYHYVYEPIPGIYTYQQTIGNPEPGNYRYFGNTLAVEGDHLMIGTSQSSIDDYDGTVLYYERLPFNNQYNYTQKITVPYGSDNDNFGTGIAVDSDRMVVSAPGHDAKGLNAGALFVFERDGSSWNQTKTLSVADLIPATFLGTSLSTYSFWSNSIIVGSRSYNQSTGTVHFLKVK